MLRRYNDWPERLAEFTKGAERRLFRYGEWDCAMLSADCVRVLTGEDLAAEFRDQYDSAESAAYAIAKSGHGNLRDMVSAKLPEIEPLMAQRGDVVMIEQDGTDALGICVGIEIIAAGPDGLTRLPITAALAAWRV